MYLRGNKQWNTLQRKRRRSNPWRVALLLILIAVALYFNQVVVPATPPLFVDTPTPTRSSESFLNQADELYKSGKLTQAIEAYKQAISADPNNGATYISLARLQVFAGQYPEAVTNAQNALLKNPNNPLAHAVLGWAISYTGDYLAAEAQVKNALELDANNALAHAFYAEILISNGDSGDVEKAISESRTALDLDPSLLEVQRARGIVLLNTGNLDEAVQAYKAAIAINSKIYDIHLGLGVTYKALNENDQAVEELLAAYALNPNDPDIPTEIARTYANAGQFGKAVQYAEQAVKVKAEDPRLHGNLGTMYYRGAELDKAIPELSLAIKGGTTADNIVVEGLPLDYGRVAEYYWFYGFALAKSNRCAEAVPIFQALLTGVPDYELAVDNANAGLELCLQSLTTATPTPKVTPKP
jgi:tetratricopeptide (TPR) repeat protein